MGLTYTEAGIADADFAVLKPCKGSQHILLRDNPKASHKYVARTGNGTDKTGTETVADDGTLEFAVTANTVYDVVVYGGFEAAPDNGIRMAINAPAASTVYATFQWTQSDNGDGVPVVSIGGFGTGIATEIGSVSDLGDSDPHVGSLILHAFVATGANSGTVALQYAQWDAGVGTTRTLAGTILVYHRVDPLV